VYAQSEIIVDVSDEPASKTAKRIVGLLMSYSPEENN
jgi:hypothetical protein